MGDVDHLDGTAARFHEPRFLAIDPSDRYLYVSDVMNHKLRRVDLSVSSSSSSSSLSSPSYSVVTYGTFATETNGIAIDSSGRNLYAVSTGSHSLYQIPILASGEYPSPRSGWTLLTSTRRGPPRDGPLSMSEWSSPSSIAIDGQDNLYVMDHWDSSSSSSSSDETTPSRHLNSNNHHPYRVVHHEEEELFVYSHYAIRRVTLGI
jgi:sugar lactone lactonase YvrE